MTITSQILAVMATLLLPSVIDLCLAASTNPEETVEFYTDRCLDGKFHKDKPGPEGALFSQCVGWKDRSCCTEEITEDLHLSPTWHNFDWNHCDRPLSDLCEQWMRQDLCFYECSPNVGPWLVPQEITIRNERFMHVPLCQSECNVWWEACKDDFTCKDNWGKGWNWTAGGNSCPEGSTCQTFEAQFNNATSFCERIWDHSFEVVPDTESCMVLWFDPQNGNPNEEVALKKAEALVRGAADSSIHVSTTLQVFLGLMAATLAIR